LLGVNLVEGTNASEHSATAQSENDDPGAINLSPPSENLAIWIGKMRKTW